MARVLADPMGRLMILSSVDDLPNPPAPLCDGDELYLGMQGHRCEGCKTFWSVKALAEGWRWGQEQGLVPMNQRCTYCDGNWSTMTCPCCSVSDIDAWTVMRGEGGNPLRAAVEEARVRISEQGVPRQSSPSSSGKKRCRCAGCY